jgi:hypothetical protein
MDNRRATVPSSEVKDAVEGGRLKGNVENRSTKQSENNETERGLWVVKLPRPAHKRPADVIGAARTSSRG